MAVEEEGGDGVEWRVYLIATSVGQFIVWQLIFTVVPKSEKHQIEDDTQQNTQ